MVFLGSMFGKTRTEFDQRQAGGLPSSRSPASPTSTHPGPLRWRSWRHGAPSRHVVAGRPHRRHRRLFAITLYGVAIGEAGGMALFAGMLAVITFPGSAVLEAYGTNVAADRKQELSSTVARGGEGGQLPRWHVRRSASGRLLRAWYTRRRYGPGRSASRTRSSPIAPPTLLAVRRRRATATDLEGIGGRTSRATTADLPGAPPTVRSGTGAASRPSRSRQSRRSSTRSTTTITSEVRRERAAIKQDVGDTGGRRRRLRVPGGRVPGVSLVGGEYVPFAPIPPTTPRRLEIVDPARPPSGGSAKRALRLQLLTDLSGSMWGWATMPPACATKQRSSRSSTLPPSSGEMPAGALKSARSISAHLSRPHRRCWTEAV